MARGGKGGGINIVLTADANQLKQGLAEARAALSKTADAAQADQKRLADAAAKFTNQATNAGTLRSQSRALFNLAASYEDMGAAGSKAFRETLQQAGRLRDRMGDLQMAVEAGHMEGKIKVFGVAMQNAVGVIAGAEGAMHLLGIKTDDAAKLTAKLQSLMAVSQGIGSIIGMMDAMKALAVSTDVAAAAQKALNIVQGLSPMAWVGIAAAAVVLAFGKFSSEAKKLTERTKTLNNIHSETTELLKKEYAEHYALTSIVKSEITTRQQKESALKKLKELYPGYLDNLSIEKTSTKVLNAEMDKLNKTIYQRAQAQAAMSELTKIAGEEMVAMANLEKRRAERLTKSQGYSALGMSPGEQDKALASIDAEIKLQETAMAKFTERKNSVLDFMNLNKLNADKNTANTSSEIKNNKAAEETYLLRMEAEGASAQAIHNKKIELMTAELNKLKAANKDAETITAQSEAIKQEKYRFRIQQQEDERQKAQEQEKRDTEYFLKWWEDNQTKMSGAYRAPEKFKTFGGLSKADFENAMRTNRKFYDTYAKENVKNYEAYREWFAQRVKAGGGIADIIAPPAEAEKIAANFGKIITTVSTESQRAAIRQTAAQTEALNAGLKNMTYVATDAFGQLFEDMASGSEYAMKDFGNNLLMAVAGFMKTLGSAMIAAAVASDVFQKALLTHPVAAIAAGAALVAASGVVKGLMKKNLGGNDGGGGSDGGPPSIRRFASGGIISGPTIGMMGEYPGARSNPEVVAPLDKLKNLIGQPSGDGGQLVTRISGQDLLIMLDRAETYRGRIR